MTILFLVYFKLISTKKLSLKENSTILNDVNLTNKTIEKLLNESVWLAKDVNEELTDFMSVLKQHNFSVIF